MYPDNTNSSLFTFRRQDMPKRKTTTLSLAIVCFTLLAALALIRDDLCKVEYRNGAMLLNVVLAYEVRG
ncbi:Hok/gef cell toxic protein (plasmid) [Shewanella baltica OS223]|uniref:Hok/Gef family protein n=2 Tax=Shewanella baltica TaxID=62322 RepID=UPI0001883FAB|nr:Hok/gef cell toxic protein [Shewanella baltica OS223]